jgi:hypothetical protein
VTAEKLPLPPRYDLDLEPVPWALPEPVSWAGLAALASQFPTSRPDRLECHPSVWHALMSAVPPPSATCSWLTSGLERFWGIDVIRKPYMEPGAWSLWCGDEQIDSGTIALT